MTLGDQYHLMHPIDPDSGRYLYLVLEREAANLALARLALGEACEAKLQLVPRRVVRG